MLTDKQKLFCIEYCKNFNATQSYVNVYKTVNFNSARVQASRLLTNDNILSYIDELKKSLTSNLKLEINDILENLTKIAFSDMGNYVEWGNKPDDGNLTIEDKNYAILKDSSLLDTSLVTEIQSTKAGLKIKLADKLKALGMLLEYFNYSNVAEEKEAKTFVINYPMENKDGN
jgi:phage terminase small subunit